MSIAYAVVVPVRFGAVAPSPQVYLRRRVVAMLALTTMVLALWAGAGHVLASRGSAPASAPAVRPAATLAANAQAAKVLYVVQPGDTLWSIAAAQHGRNDLGAYVDQLVGANGGTSLAVGQVLALP